jgi:hypothetical protein
MADTPFIFVSYARRDSEVVSRIVDELQNLGIRTWVDSAQLIAGTSWVRAISDALQEAQALLFFISPASVQSKVVTHELETALRRGVRVLPVLLELTRQCRMIGNLVIEFESAEPAIAEMKFPRC